MRRFRPRLFVLLIVTLLLGVVVWISVLLSGDRGDSSSDLTAGLGGYTNVNGAMVGILMLTNTGRSHLFVWGPVKVEVQSLDDRIVEPDIHFSTNALPGGETAIALVKIPDMVTSGSAPPQESSKWRASWMVQRSGLLDRITFELYRIGLRWVPWRTDIDLRHFETDWYPLDSAKNRTSARAAAGHFQ